MYVNNIMKYILEEYSISVYNWFHYITSSFEFCKIIVLIVHEQNFMILLFHFKVLNEKNLTWLLYYNVCLKIILYIIHDMLYIFLFIII